MTYDPLLCKLTMLRQEIQIEFEKQHVIDGRYEEVLKLFDQVIVYIKVLLSRNRGGK